MKYKTQGAIEAIQYSPIYSQQATAPDWFSEIEEHGFLAVSAVMGSSLWNEYYGFKDRKQAIEWIARTFNSERFNEQFVYLEGEIYHCEELEFDEETCEYVFDENTTPAELQDLVWAESRF